MSIRAVAAEAGVSVPTLRLRWQTKADLATAALGMLQTAEPPATTGDSRTDLITILRNYQSNLFRPNGMTMLGTLLAEEEQTPELLLLFRKRVIQPRREMIRTVLKRARAAGELRSDADIEAAVTMLIGGFYAQYLAGKRVPKNWPERLLEVVWNGLCNQDLPNP